MDSDPPSLWTQKGMDQVLGGLVKAMSGVSGVHKQVKLAKLMLECGYDEEYATRKWKDLRDEARTQTSKILTNDINAMIQLNENIHLGKTVKYPVSWFPNFWILFFLHTRPSDPLAMKEVVILCSRCALLQAFDLRRWPPESDTYKAAQSFNYLLDIIQESFTKFVSQEDFLLDMAPVHGGQTLAKKLTLLMFSPNKSFQWAASNANIKGLCDDTEILPRDDLSRCRSMLLKFPQCVADGFMDIATNFLTSSSAKKVGMPALARSLAHAFKIFSVALCEKDAGIFQIALHKYPDHGMVHDMTEKMVVCIDVLATKAKEWSQLLDPEMRVGWFCECWISVRQLTTDWPILRDKSMLLKAKMSPKDIEKFEFRSNALLQRLKAALTRLEPGDHLDDSPIPPTVHSPILPSSHLGLPDDGESWLHVETTLPTTSENRLAGKEDGALHPIRELTNVRHQLSADRRPPVGNTSMAHSRRHSVSSSEARANHDSLHNPKSRKRQLGDGSPIARAKITKTHK